jgi:hypothetical protein
LNQSIFYVIKNLEVQTHIDKDPHIDRDQFNLCFFFSSFRQKLVEIRKRSKRKMSNLEEFWLISVPGDKTPQQAWEKLVQSIDNIANPYKFNIPNLKVGTLDQLFGLSDDLGKLDSFVEK